MRWKRAFSVSAVSWAAAIPLAAFAVSRPGGLWFAFAYSVYAVGHVICHQLPERSFHWGATQLPVCARCTGLYLGAALAALAPGSSRGLIRTLLSRPRVVLLVAAIPTVLTLVYEWTTGAMPANWLRALAGVPLGAAVVWIIREVN